MEKWFWIAFAAIAYFTGLVNSVAMVSALSIYALYIGAAAAEQAAEAKDRAEQHDEGED